MKTEFPDRYITLGLKIAYYRKNPDIRKKPLQNLLARVLILLDKSKVLALFVAYL